MTQNLRIRSEAQVFCHNPVDKIRMNGYNKKIQ